MYYLYNSCIALHTLNSTSCSVKAQGLAHGMFSDDEDIHVPREGTSSKRDASDLKAASKANKKRRCKKVANEKVANEKKGKHKFKRYGDASGLKASSTDNEDDHDND